MDKNHKNDKHSCIFKRAGRITIKRGITIIEFAFDISVSLESSCTSAQFKSHAKMLWELL